MPKTTIPEAKRKSHESMKTVDTEIGVRFVRNRSGTGARTQHDGEPVGTMSVNEDDSDAPESTGRTD